MSISLVREHTEGIHPPRALWVPFPLGRPLGAPNEPEFQQRVLDAALGLLAEPSGPVLADFPEDAPAGSDGDGPWACPLPLPPAVEPANEEEALRMALQDEVARLQPWYEEAVSKNGRTGVGVSGLDANRMGTLADLLVSIAFGTDVEPPDGASAELPQLIRFATDDLKAFYLEAVAAQPSATAPSPDELNVWLLGQTRLGEALYRARETLSANEDRAWSIMAFFMVPARYAGARPSG